MCGEQIRWFDLKRTKKLVEYVKLHNMDAKDNIQEFADKVLQVKNETFPVWLVENGYSAQDVSIHLHIKTEDGTTIAKEKFSGSMKVTK